MSNRDEKQAMVEVAHEALFISWDRLKQWIEGKEVIYVRNRIAVVLG